MRTAPPDPFAAQVRALLDEVDRSLAQQPAPTAPWARIQHFIVTSRTRRRRRAAWVVAATAVVVAALLVVQQGTFGSADDKTAPADRRTPEFLVETRGNLAENAQWLEELAKYAARQNPFGGRPADRPVRDVRVVYASDIGDSRVALVTGTWPQHPGQPYLVEFSGPAGAAVDRLTLGSFGAVEGTKPLISVLSSATGVDQQSEPEARAPNAAVSVVAPQPQDAWLQEPPTIDAQGKVTQHRRRIGSEAGVQELAVSKPGHYALVVRGENAFYKDFFTEPIEVRPELLGRTPERGGPVVKATQLEGVARDTWLAARQPFAEGSWKLLAVDPAKITAQHRNRALAGVLTLPSGARVLAAGHISAPYGNAEGGPHSRLDIAQLLPAGEDSGAAMAWTSYRDTTSGSSDKVIQTSALGPVGTTTVEWSGPQGVTTSPAPNTLATTRRTDVDSVRFLGASGAELATTPVREPEAVQFHRTGGTPREVMWTWLLPQVKEGLIGR